MVRRLEIENFTTPPPKGNNLGGGGEGGKIDVFLLKFSVLFMHIDQTNWLYINDDQWKVYKNCNFIIHKAGVLVLRRSHISHTVKMHYFLKTFLCSQAYKRHSEYKNKDDHGMVYQNCKFHDPLAGVLVLGRGHISHSLKCLISWKIYFILPSIDQTNWVYSNAISYAEFSFVTL